MTIGVRKEKGEAMSIILKGIDIHPKDFKLYLIAPNGEVIEINQKGMPKDGNIYQAIQIPKGHGRLIDIDALIDKSEPKNWNGIWMNDIIDAPTILEAEESNERQ
jgi:hypothetical protein